MNKTVEEKAFYDDKTQIILVDCRRQCYRSGESFNRSVFTGASETSSCHFNLHRAWSHTTATPILALQAPSALSSFLLFVLFVLVRSHSTNWLGVQFFAHLLLEDFRQLRSSCRTKVITRNTCLPHIWDTRIYVECVFLFIKKFYTR